MSQRRSERPDDPEAQHAALESGVLPRGLAEDCEPPWPIVHAYLARGDHRAWVESWAARSPAFADVLEALRNDHRDRQGARGVVLQLRKRR